jgi:Holliday junction resolvasome RuvABC ATP-dependent DNA helicase subunit
MPISIEAAIEIAGRSRGTPRIANALLRRVLVCSDKGMVQLILKLLAMPKRA